MNAAASPPRWLVAAAYALMCAIWGTTWLGIKVSLRYVPPIAGVGVRFIIAGLILYAVAVAARRTISLKTAPWKLILVLSAFLFGCNYILTYLGETHVSSGLTAVLFGVLPFFTFGFGHYLVNERARAMTWIGAIAAFAGVGVISLEAGLHGSMLYALAVVGASFTSAFANVYAKRHAHNDPLVTLPPAMLLAGIAVAAVGFSMEHVDVQRAFSLDSIGAILYLSVAGSAIAFFLNMWLLQHVRVGVVGLSSLITPVIAVIVGVFFGGEQFGPSEAAGAALVIAGVWIALKETPNLPAERTAA